MDNIILKPGDVFSTENPMALGKLISWGESLPWRDGHKSEYGHSGIITDPSGITIEELWTFRVNNLSSYKGDKMIIGRWKGMTPDAWSEGMKIVGDDLYQPYPLWRLFLMLIPNAAKVVSTGQWAVCSERTFEFLFSAGWRGTDKIKTWQDNDPQALADVIHAGGEFETVYEGIW